MTWEERPGDKAHQMNLKAIPHLEKWAKEEQPFLLFLRHMDPHSPYLPPAPFDRMFYSGEDECDPRHLESPDNMRQVFDFAPFADFFRSWMPPGITDGKYVIAQYDGAIAYMDACLARMFTRLDELGLADNTIVILTGDHGESLLEHQIWFDHHGLYETNIHVPLIIKAPGRLPQGVRIPGNVAHQDMLPTILDLLGEHALAKSLKMDGKSVVPLVNGERRDNHDELYLTECTWMRKRGWRTHEWKLIQAMEPDFHGFPPVELYHLPSDPDEKVNLADSEPEVVAFLIERMERWVAKRCAETGATDPILQYKMGLDRRIGSIGQARDLQAKSSTPAGAEKTPAGDQPAAPARKRAPRARKAAD
jgi:arylsulfatase A-like enzyme